MQDIITILNEVLKLYQFTFVIGGLSFSVLDFMILSLLCLFIVKFLVGSIKGSVDR